MQGVDRPCVQMRHHVSTRPPPERQMSASLRDKHDTGLDDVSFSGLTDMQWRQLVKSSCIHFRVSDGHVHDHDNGYGKVCGKAVG